MEIIGSQGGRIDLSSFSVVVVVSSLCGDVIAERHLRCDSSGMVRLFLSEQETRTRCDTCGGCLSNGDTLLAELKLYNKEGRVRCALAEVELKRKKCYERS